MRFYPADPRQALRIRRYLMAAGTSLLVPPTLFLAHFFGLMPMDAALAGTAIVLVLIAVFYLLFRSGLNLRRADPSLTMEMIGAAILFLAFIAYYFEDGRGALSLFYLAAMMFGVLRLDTRRLLALAALALAAHGCMLALSLANGSVANPRTAYLQYAVLFIVLPWFAAMGGYVNSLRHRLSDSNRRLKDAYERIEKVASRDELTGLYNRRFLMDLLGRERSRALRRGSRLAVCMLDIDHFKQINDALGHAAGDVVLGHFARVVVSGLRTVDVFGRYGGEEFLLVMPDTDEAGARSAAERTRALVEAAGFPLPAGRRVTVTAGIAVLRDGESVGDLLGRADAALYQGKSAGRNRVGGLG